MAPLGDWRDLGGHFGALVGPCGRPWGTFGHPWVSWAPPLGHLGSHGIPFVATWVHFWAPGCPKDACRGRFGALEAPFPADFKRVGQI